MLARVASMGPQLGRQYDNVVHYLCDKVYPDGAEKSEKYMYVLRRLAKKIQDERPDVVLC